MNWLYYIAEANVYLGVFYLAYCLFLNRDTHYQLKRIYLVFSCIISLILPVLQVGALRRIEPVTQPIRVITYYRPVIQTVSTIPENHQIIQPFTTPVIEHHFTLQDALLYAYLAGAAVLLMVLFIKLIILFRLMRNQKSVKQDKYRLICLAGTDVAFSFFNYLFIGTEAAEADTMMRHELVHIRQKHSVDIMFLELLKIINWFNPFVYLLQNSLKSVHEYIADEQTAAYETDALTYSSFLVNNAYSAGGLSITNSFFNYNLLKKRIIMLNQQRSGNLARLKYLVVIPICAALLCVSTLAFSKTYGLVDLAPAATKLSGPNAMVNASHKVKRNRLKITQNGVTTITDQFSVNQKNGKVVYTAGTITKTDRTLLLKNHNIKVEVVADSTTFTTADGKLMLPVVNVDGYDALDYFLHNKIQYKSAKGDKGGLVEVGFSLDKDRHITDAKVVKSGGAQLDAIALNGFTSYKGIVNDDPGKKLKIGVYFFTDDYSIFKTDSLSNDPQFEGELIITNYKYPYSVTNKGYEYSESGNEYSVSVSGVRFAEVSIYEKNGDVSSFFENTSTSADLKMLKDKYGYTFPSASSSILQMMFPKDVGKKRLAYIYEVASYLEAPYSDLFYDFITTNIKYPQEAKKELTAGVVILDFNLDNKGLISDVKIAKSGGNGFDEAAMTALKSYPDPIKDNAGKHSIAILFCIAEKKIRPVVDAQFKKDGYVGELAVSDIKSLIGRTLTFKLYPMRTSDSPKSDKN